MTGCIPQSTLETKPIIFAPEQKKFLEKGSSVLIFLFRFFIKEKMNVLHHTPKNVYLRAGTPALSLTASKTLKL